MWIAEMDTPLAEPIAAALSAAIARGDTGYAHPGRLPEAFADFARRRFGWWPNPSWMVVVPDVIQGITEVIRVTTEPGAGVVVNTPAYPPFFSFITRAERRVIEVPLARAATGEYSLDLDAVEGALARPDVTAYLICNPHNPTGLVLTPDELRAVAELAARHEVRLLVDEIHGPLTHSGLAHTPMGTVDSEAAGRAIAFVSASKAWNLPGLKAALAVACGADGWEVLSTVPRDVTFGSGLLGVIANEAAFLDGEPWLDALLAGLDDNRALLGALLAQWLPEVGYVPPQGTFLAWLDLRRFPLDREPAEVLLERGRVALYPGPMFGVVGRGHVRLNFATSPERLSDGVRRMAAALRD